jgi:mercuric ion transport protein
MEWVTRVVDKAGALGTVVSAASCPVCFPAIASLGAAAGLGFLSGFEGLFIGILLPTFAAVALIANAAGWFTHRQWHRALLGVIGPAIVLAAMLLFFGQWWTARLLYTGLAFMVGVSLWDLISPAARRPFAAMSRESVLTCPHCGHAKAEVMPTDACQFFYECENCRTLLRPKPGDCCVFCSFGSTKCPPVQLAQCSCR